MASKFVLSISFYFIFQSVVNVDLQIYVCMFSSNLHFFMNFDTKLARKHFFHKITQNFIFATWGIQIPSTKKRQHNCTLKRAHGWAVHTALESERCHRGCEEDTSLQEPSQPASWHRVQSSLLRKERPPETPQKRTPPRIKKIKKNK